MNSTSKKDYTFRVNKALEFIDEHLHENLSLEVLSNVAAFSSYHFHRVFKFVTNETLNQYITRKRIEKAGSILFRNKNIEVSEIYSKVGFNSHSAFTRAFNNYYGISPTDFRTLSEDRFSKISKVNSKNGKTTLMVEEYICNINNLKNWIKMNGKVDVKIMPEMYLGYKSHIGNPHLLGNTYEDLIKWAAPKGLMNNPNLKMLTVYHDSYKTTSPDKIRMSACIVLEKPIEGDKEVNFMTLKEAKCIVGSFKIQVQEFEKSWTSLFVWMNENGYKKADSNPFEIYHNNFNEHPEKKSIVDLCIPVE